MSGGFWAENEVSNAAKDESEDDCEGEDSNGKKSGIGEIDSKDVGAFCANRAEDGSFSARFHDDA